MAAKTFVLDTNVLIHDPDSIYRFQENEVVIPLGVVKELDHLKKGTGGIAYTARKVLRELDAFRERGDISKGVPLPEAGTLRILSGVSGSGTTDDEVIALALDLQRDSGGRNHVVVVSKDTTVRIKAGFIGITTEDYKNDKTTIFQKYGGVVESEYTNGIRSVRYQRVHESLFRLKGTDEKREVKRGKSLDGIVPKNGEQECAVDALLNPDVDIVALTGKAGTGKTLLAIAAGIHQVIKKYPLYEQVLVCRPIIPMGNDIGYLPGSMEHKLAPWMQPIFDNLEVIVNTPKERKDGNDPGSYRSYRYLMEKGLLHVEALTYIRGRSLPRRYFVVDEAQNLRPVDVKAIVTRCGAGTKVVFTGDILQIDNPFMDSMSNGLSYLISCFINEENFCYLNLRESVRSKLAEQGARLL